MKRAILLLALVLSSGLLFASESSAIASVSASSIASKLYPTYKGFGTIVGEDFHPVLKYFSTEMKKDFNFEWTENNFSPNVRVMLSRITPYLSEIMPIKNIVFSKPESEDDRVSFSFILTASNDALYEGSAVVETKDSNKIVAISVDKK